MSNTTILGTGLNGLVGSKVVSTWEKEYQFENLDISHPTHPTDITNPNQVMAAIENSPAEVILHFAAFTDVTAAWEQRDDKNGPAYKVNVLGTQNLVRAAEATNKHLIHISTAFVFDGEKPDLYTEADTPHPIEWYGQTKWEAEQVVMASSAPWTIFRIDFPFRSDAFAKPDIARKSIATAQKGYPLFTDHFFGPTYIDDFAKVIEWAIRTQSTGLFHATSGERWSDFDFCKLLNDTHQLGLNPQPGTLDEYLKTLQRPYQRNTAMSNQKLVAQLDFKQHSIAEAVAELVL